MNESVTSLILIAATILVGLVVFSYLGGYFTAQSAQVNFTKEAQVLATSLRVGQLTNQEGNEEYVVLYPYLKGYSGPLYVMAFSVSTYYSSAQNQITPSAPTFSGYVHVNGTPTSENVKIYSTSGSVLYVGNAEIYQTAPNSVQFLNFKATSTVVVWFIASLDGQMVRIGYTVI